MNKSWASRIICLFLLLSHNDRCCLFHSSFSSIVLLPRYKGLQGYFVTQSLLLFVRLKTENSHLQFPVSKTKLARSEINAMSLKNPLNKNHKGKHFTYYNNNDQPTLARISQLVYFIFFYILKFFYFLFLHGRIIQFLIMVVKMSIKSKKKP